MNLEESAFIQRPTLLGAQPESPGRKQFDSARKTSKKTAKLPVHWMPSSTPAQARKRMRLGMWLGRPQPSGTTEGTAPCVGSALMHEGNFGGPRIDASVFPCSGKPPRRMLSLTGTGAVRLRTPWNMATMPPR